MPEPIPETETARALRDLLRHVSDRRYRSEADGCRLDGNVPEFEAAERALHRFDATARSAAPSDQDTRLRLEPEAEVDRLYGQLFHHHNTKFDPPAARRCIAEALNHIRTRHLGPDHEPLGPESDLVRVLDKRLARYMASHVAAAGTRDFVAEILDAYRKSL